MNVKQTYITILYILIGLRIHAQESFNYLDSLMDHYEDEDAFNGVVLIAENGEPSFSRSIGYADFYKKVKLNLHTPMHLASNSKAFTVMGIMILQERGLLNYDDKLKIHLPTLPYDDIEIKHLMTSTSGLKRLYNKAANGDELITIQEMIDYCSKKKPKLSFKPGEKFQSSVVGYCLLAGVIEKITGKTYSNFMEDEIFKPLGMKNTFVLDRNTWNRPRAISYDKKNKVKEWYLGSYIGGVSIYASADDLLKWDQSFYTHNLVSKETINKVYEKVQLANGDYGPMTFGSWSRWKGQEHLIFKNGDWVANNSILFRDTKQNKTIIIMNNRQNQISKFDLMEKILPELGYSF